MDMSRTIAATLLALGLGLGIAEAQDYPNQTIKLIVPFSRGRAGRFPGPRDGATSAEQARPKRHHREPAGRRHHHRRQGGGGRGAGRLHAALRRPEPRLLPGAVPQSRLRSDEELSSGRDRRHLVACAGGGAVGAGQEFAEFVAYAKANPGKLVFGFGLATMPHILGETFRQAAGIEHVRLPYRGGEQARADLLGGRVHINIAPVPQLLSLIRDGKIRPLAYTGPRRSPDLPDVPTMTESGLPQVGFNPDVWMGIFAPAGTPAAIVVKLNREINAVLKSAEMAPTLKRFGYEAKITTPAEFEDIFRSRVRKWPPLLRAAGLKPQ